MSMITGVRLQNFRSYFDQAFEFETGVNIVIGPNASGKTNLLEALYVGRIGRSFRARDLDLINYKKNWARVDIDESSGHRRTVKIQKHKLPKKSFIINNQTKKRLGSEYTLPTVLFAPDHLQILTGSPERRRNFMDLLISQLYPQEKFLFSRYQRALLQRNNILKQADIDPDNLFVWGVKLGELGAKIASLRMNLISQLNRYSSKIYSQLAGTKNSVKFHYVSSLTTDPKTYAHQLNKKLQGQTDIELGYSAYGPHRDDFMVMLNKHDSSISASRGETRTLVMVMKMIETKLIEKQIDQPPLILLDDIFSELDGKRRHQLALALDDYQTLITTTNVDVIDKKLTQNANLITL